MHTTLLNLYNNALACMICHGIIQGWKLSQWMYVSNLTYCHAINNGILEKSHSRVQEHPFCIMPSQQKIIQCAKKKLWFLTIQVSLHLPDFLQRSFLCIFFLILFSKYQFGPDAVLYFIKIPNKSYVSKHKRFCYKHWNTAT